VVWAHDSAPGHTLTGIVHKGIMAFVSSLTSKSSLLARRFRGNLNLLLRHGTTHPHGVCVHTVDGLKLALDFVHPNQRQIYEGGAFESELTEIIRRAARPDDVFVDVGANFGWHSLALLSARPDVLTAYAFEPSSKMFSLLSQSIALNKLEERCRARRLAIADKKGTSTLKTFSDLDPMHASLYPLADWKYDEEDVELDTLDSQAESFSKPPSVIKCDVEGGERDVLLGAQAVLAGKYGPPPLWFLEANYEAAGMAGFFPWDLIDIARKHAPYQAYCLRSGRVVPLAGRTSLRHGDTLILAIPDLHGERINV
jgi:FkbM family methyltransferase